MPENNKLKVLQQLANNPESPATVMGAGLSRFDSETGFAINPETQYDSQNIEALNESRAQAQSTLGRIGLMVPRIANKFLAEVAKVPGYGQGLIEAMGDKTIGEAMDNAWLNNIDTFSENFNEEFLKVYVPEAVAKGGWFKNISSASFWATEGADGVGFLTSMLVPGNVLKVLGVGNKLARLSVAGASKLGKTSKLGNTLQKTALWAGKNYDDVQAAFVNTMLESGAEAKEAFDNTLSELKQKYGNTKSEEELRLLAGEAASNVFKGNTMLLFASNLIDQVNLFGAFGTKKNIMSNMYDQGRMLPIDQVLKNVKANYKTIGKSIGSGFIKEGGLEEGTQFSMGEFYKSEALDEDKYDSIIETYWDNLDNPDLQKSIFLGGFLGGGMSVVGEINESKRTKEALLGSDDIKRNKFQKALGLSDRKGSIGIYQSLKQSLVERNNSILSALGKDENGKPILDNEKVQEILTNLNSKLTLTQMMDSAALYGDKELFNTLKNVSDLNYFLPFFQQGESGLKLLEEHITNELSQIESKKAETGEKLGVTSSPQETTSELIRKAKDLFKLYQGNVDLHKYEFPKLSGGTEQDFAEFSENIQYKKLEKALFDYSNSQAIKDLTAKLADVDRNTAEGKKEAEFIEKKIKLISDAQIENQAEYNSMFDKKALQKTYDEYLKGKKEVQAVKETAKENKVPVTEEDFNNEYLDKLTQAGYDVKNPLREEKRQPIYFVNKGRGYVAMGKPGDKSRTIFDAKTGQAVGTFNSEFYKANRETIKFVSPEAAAKANKKRKLFERKQKQLQALNEVATNTRVQYNSIIDEIDAKLAERETLTEKLKQDKQTLTEALDSKGRAKKGMKEIKAFILNGIKTLEDQIQQLDSEIEALEKAKQDLDSKKFAIEEYKTELEQLSEDEIFSFKKELEELELFEADDTRSSQLLVVNKILSDINSIISRTEESLLELGIQREAIQKLLDVYKGINAVNEINKLALLSDARSEGFKKLVEKYPFLNSYKYKQYGFLSKVNKPSKEGKFDLSDEQQFNAFQEYMNSEKTKLQLQEDLETFLTTAPGPVDMSVEDIYEDIRVTLENIDYITNDIEGLQNYIADVEELKKEYTLAKEQLVTIDSEISKLEKFLNKQVNEKRNLELVKGSIESSRKKLEGLRQLVNDVTVTINKQMVTKGSVTVANKAPLDQEPPVEETVEAIKFKNSAISNLLLRSIMPEVEYENGETKTDSQGNPITSTKRIIQVLSGFMNEFKKELNSGKYRVQFYSPSTAPDNIKELFKSEEEFITDKSIGFVILDENFNPVQYTLNGVKSTVVGFLPDKILNPASPNGLRINNKSLLAKFVYATTNSFPNMQNLPLDTDGKIAWKPIVDKYGKVTMDELLIKAKEWVEPFYQNEVLTPIRESIAKGDTFLKINSVTRGMVLTNKNNDLQSVTKVYGDGNVKIVTLADTGKEQFSGFTPGTILYENEGEYYPVEQRTITSDEINTVIYAAYQGWKDASKGNFNSDAPAFGEGKYAIFSGLKVNSYRWYHNSQSKVSVLSSLIYWGEHDSKTIENPETGKKEKIYSDFKGQIFVRSNMLYFKNPNNNWELTAIPMSTIEKAVESGNIITNPELADLITFLSKKRLNVNKELLETNTIFYYPKATFVNGKWEFTYDSFKNYQEFLTKGNAKVPKVIGTRAIQKNTANRQLAFDTDITGVPKLFTEKKTPVVPETPKPITKVVEEVVPKEIKYTVDELNELNLTSLPNGTYTLKGTFKGNPVERKFVIENGVVKQASENSVSQEFADSRNEQPVSFVVYNSNFENDSITPIVKITDYQPVEDLSNVNVNSGMTLEDMGLEETPFSDIETKRKEVRAAIQKAGQGEGGQFFVTLLDGTREAAVRISLSGNELSIGNKGMMVDLSTIVKIENPDGTVVYNITEPSTSKPKIELSKEEKKARFRARITNFKDPDDQASDRISVKPSYTKADVEKEKSYLKDKLGMTDNEIEVISGLISGRSMGRFLADGRILLSDIMEVGTAYHEAFHRVFQLYLTKQEQQDLINEFKSQKDWKDKLLPEYKNLSIERQIEEVLAEEFRDYVLSGGQKIPAKQKSFFDKLIDFIKNMLGLNSTTKEEVFSKINSGAFKNRARVYESGINADKIVKVGKIELTPTETSEIINYMNFKFFNKVFNNKTGNSDNYFSTKIDVKEIFYGKEGIYESLLNSLSVAGEAYVEEDLIEEADRLDEVIQALEKDFGSIVKVFAKNLEYFNVKANFEEEQTDNFNKPSLNEKDNTVELEVLDNQDVLDKLELNTNEDAHRDTLSIMSSVEFNTKDLMPNNIKMLIASLQDTYYDKDNKIKSKKSKVFGLIQQANWGESVNLLLNNLAGTPADINLLLDKVSELSIKHPRFLRLINYLGGYSQDFNSNDVNRFLLRTQFVSTFAKTKTNFLLTLLKDNGDYQVIDANSEQIHNRKITEALSNVKQAFSTLGSTQFQSNLNEARVTNNYAKMVDVLGIDIKPEDITESVKKELDNIYPIISKAIADPTFKINKFDELFQGKDGFKSRLKKIFEEAYKLEDNVELQLVNGEGKSVYSISLNTYQTLIIDQINYWVAKGNSREQRLDLLEKNLPHIFNLSTGHSYWLNNVLDTGAKLNYNLSDALKDEDGNGTHVSELKEADLIALTFNNLLRGYYMSMKHSDRSMFPTYSFSNNYTIVKGGDLLTKGTSVMINYLKDEVNKVKNLKGSGADLVKYYKDIANNFERNIFDGIISKEQFMNLVKSENPDYENATLISTIKAFLDKKYKADLALFEENLLHRSYANPKERVSKQHIGISNDLIKEYGNFEEAVKFASINSYLNHIEETKLFIGDLGQYKDATDIFKRLNMQSSTGNVLAVYDEMNDFISEQNKKDVVKIGDQEIVYKEGKADGQIRELVVTDFNVISAVFDNIEKAILHDLSKRLSPEEAKKQAKFFTKSYKEMVENDGISYANIFSIREFMIRAGEWSIEHGNNFELQLAYLNGDMEAVRKLVTVPSTSNPEKYFNKTFQAFTSLKPQYVGPNYLIDKDQYEELSPEERHNIIAGRKTAYFPLIPIEIQGTVLDQMQKFMIKNGIDYIHMTGAAKFGIKQERSFYKTEGNQTTGFFDQEINPNEIGVLDYRFMKNQVAINNQPKNKITSSTQGRKNIVEGLYENGLPIDYSGEDWENKSEVHKLATEYQKIQYHLIKSNIDKLLTELDAVKTEDGVSINNIENFRELLTKLAEDKNSSENIIDAISDFLVTTKFIELLPNSTKIQNILHSLVTNRVLVEKRPGDMVPQMAISGSEIKNRIINEKGFIESNKDVLNFYDVKFDESGKPIEVTPAEIKLQLPPSWLPMLFEKYSNDLGVDGNNIMAVVDAFNKDIAQGNVEIKVKGLRIPNQQLSSNDIFKVKSFGYPFLQGFALVPSEIVAKTGGDFDIDKISIYWPNLDKKTGKPIEYDNSKPLEENTLEAIQNRLLEVEEQLLLHPLQVRNLLSPVADAELKSIAENVKKPKDKLSNLFSFSFNVKATLRFLAGKAGVGQMATWITFNDIAQLNNLELNDIFFDKDGNTLTTDLPDELGVKDKSLGRIYGVDNKSIANALSAILTSQVDLVKDPYAQSINLINQTLNSIAYLLVRGVPLDKVISFFNQDVIKEYLKMQRLNETNVIKATGRKKIKDNAVVGNEMGMELSKNELISEVLLKHPSPEATKTLQEFLLIIEQTKAMLKVKNYLSPDTKFMKDKNSVKDYLALKEQVKFENIVKNVDAPLLAGKLLGGFSQGRDLYMDLYKPYYITELEEVRPFLDSFKAMIKENLTSDNKVKFANKVDDAFINYLLQMYHPELKGKYSQFMKGKSSTAKKVHSIIKNPNHPLHDNILIKNLTVLLNNNKGEDNLKLFKTKMIPFENNLMIDAFNEIAELEPYLAKDLIIYNIFQSGIAPSPYQLQKIFPYIQALNFQQRDLLQEVENIVNGIKNWPEVMSRFTHAFLASNMEYNPTASQKYSKNYKPYPYYKQWNASTKSYDLVYNGKVFSPIGDVRGIDYSIDFPYSNIKVEEKQPETKPIPKGTINVYWGQAESGTSTRILSNLAPRKFMYESTDGITREYGSVEHAYQSNKNGKFDKNTYDAYVAKGGYGVKIAPKLTEVGKRGNLQLMKDLVVESFKQNPNSEAAKKLLQYENFTHNTNELIDKAFLEGLKLAQQQLLNNKPTPKYSSELQQELNDYFKLLPKERQAEFIEKINNFVNENGGLIDTKEKEEKLRDIICKF